jgi:phage repressor protein C with HTH and peptisase S24 domain
VDLILLQNDFVDLCRSVLQSGRKIRCRLTGKSMVPVIQDGEEVEISPASRPAIGDIVLCRRPSGRVLVHRIVLVRGSKYKLKGDSSPKPDEGWVDRNSVVGVVTGVRKGKTWKALDTPWARRWLPALRQIRKRLRSG